MHESGLQSELVMLKDNGRLEKERQNILQPLDPTPIRKKILDSSVSKINQRCNVDKDWISRQRQSQLHQSETISH
jgi:hypothetical protein